MKVPQVQYATTPDGYSLAYAVSGKGLPLILTPPALNHIQLVWEWPSHRRWLEGLAQRFRLIQFDPRGQGMSTRGLPQDFTLEDYERDLETLVEQLGLSRFAIIGTCLMGHAALRYAARHPDQVEALVLLTTAVDNRAWPINQFIGLGRENWDLLLWSRLPPGLAPSETESRIDQTRQMIAAEDAIARWNGCLNSDVSDVLAEVRTPTLVLHPRNFVHLGTEQSVSLAAGLPNARLVLIDSDDPGDLHGRPESALSAIDDFFTDLAASTAPEPNAVPHAEKHLSARQTEVLALVARGRTNREIAEELVISLRTVERHIEELYAKLQVRNRAEATAYALGRFGGK
jgi:pimeloyl-ACP methyl ester carboxylesterase/DNA-binding CsgD family transcriptional regulator